MFNKQLAAKMLFELGNMADVDYPKLAAVFRNLAHLMDCWPKYEAAQCSDFCTNVDTQNAKRLNEIVVTALEIRNNIPVNTTLSQIVHIVRLTVKKLMFPHHLPKKSLEI